MSDKHDTAAVSAAVAYQDLGTAFELSPLLVYGKEYTEIIRAILHRLGIEPFDPDLQLDESKLVISAFMRHCIQETHELKGEYDKESDTIGPVPFPFQCQVDEEYRAFQVNVLPGFVVQGREAVEGQYVGIGHAGLVMHKPTIGSLFALKAMCRQHLLGIIFNYEKAITAIAEVRERLAKESWETYSSGITAAIEALLQFDENYNCNAELTLEHKDEKLVIQLNDAGACVKTGDNTMLIGAYFFTLQECQLRYNHAV